MYPSAHHSESAGLAVRLPVPRVHPLQGRRTFRTRGQSTCFRDVRHMRQRRPYLSKCRVHALRPIWPRSRNVPPQWMSSTHTATELRARLVMILIQPMTSEPHIDFTLSTMMRAVIRVDSVTRVSLDFDVDPCNIFKPPRGASYALASFPFCAS